MLINNLNFTGYLKATEIHLQNDGFLCLECHHVIIYQKQHFFSD